MSLKSKKWKQKVPFVKTWLAFSSEYEHSMKGLQGRVRVLSNTHVIWRSVYEMIIIIFITVRQYGTKHN